MSTSTEQLLNAAGQAFIAGLRDQLPANNGLNERNGRELGSQAADWAAHAVLALTGTSVLARRIGPVYGTDDVAKWMVPPGRQALTGEAMRKRAKQHRLVAFHSDDGVWAFPAWQFTRAAGRLQPRAEVIALWQQLPHDSWLTKADLAAWMNTSFHLLDGTPADRAHNQGANDAALLDAVARLQSRAA